MSSSKRRQRNRHLGFSKFKILTVEKVKKVEMHQHVKFRRNRSNRVRDMRVSMLC